MRGASSLPVLALLLLERCGCCWTQIRGTRTTIKHRGVDVPNLSPGQRIDFAPTSDATVHLAQAPCAPGTGGASCAPCDSRSVSSRGEECQTCGPGTAPDGANVAWVPCAAGKVGENGLCSACADGRQPTSDRTSCTECPIGQWAAGGTPCKTFIAFRESALSETVPGSSAYFWCESRQLVRWIFDSVDGDKDGTVRRSELRQSPFDESLRARWSMIDTDGDHQVSWQDWSNYFSSQQEQLGERWRSYILHTVCKAVDGEGSCIPTMRGQPSNSHGACIACMNPVADDGRACKILPTLACKALPNGTITCTLSSMSTSEMTDVIAFGSQFDDPACLWVSANSSRTGRSRSQTVSFGQAELASASCSFAQSTSDAGYRVDVGVRTSSDSDSRVVSHAVYSVDVIPSGLPSQSSPNQAFSLASVDSVQAFAVAVTGPTTVPVSPLTLSIHRSCEDEMVAPTTAEEYLTTTYPTCLKAVLCCGYTFSTADAKGVELPPLRSFSQTNTTATDGNASGMVSFDLGSSVLKEGGIEGYVNSVWDALPGERKMPSASASVTRSDDGTELYISFQPRSVVDKMNDAFFHITTAVKTHAGKVRLLKSTLPNVRIKRTKANEALPTVAASDRASHFQVVPKLAVAGTVLILVGVGGLLVYRAYVNRKKKLVPYDFTQQKLTLAGENRAFMAQNTEYKTFDVAGGSREFSASTDSGEVSGTE